MIKEMNVLIRHIFPVLACLWVICLLLGCPARAAAEGTEPEVSATSAILVEASTGRVLWEKNADEERSPASMTKIMTCLLALERLKPDTEILISPAAEQTEDVYLGFGAGALFRAEELEYGLMLLSDNGAAVALAEEMGGSVSGFAKLMNEKARDLGMTSTHFVTPNGLTAPGHHSTARDMAKLACHAMQSEQFREIVGTKKRMVHWELPKGKALEAENSNKLLGVYQGMTGIKTGWTQAAGGCLAASAQREGIELIAVVMNAPTPDDRFVDARKILDYGFQNAKLIKGVSKERLRAYAWVSGGTTGRVPLRLASDINLLLLGGESKERYKVNYEIEKVMDAPVKAGQKAGRAVLTYDGREVGSVDILAEQAVPAGFSFYGFMISLFKPFLS